MNKNHSLETAAEYIRQLSEEEFQALGEAVLGILQIMRGEDVPFAIKHAMVLEMHLAALRVVYGLRVRAQWEETSIY